MEYTREELDQMSIVSPELAEAMKQRPHPGMKPGDGLKKERVARAGRLKALRHLMPVPGPIPDHVSEKDLFVTARDGYQIKTVLYTPTKQQSHPGPLIILFHEGGWLTGDLSDEEFDARLFSRDLGATCLNVDYRLAPENQFPTGINDCWDVVQWAASNVSTSSTLLRADLSKGFIVGGSSAGGGISAVIAHLSRNTNLQPPITGQWLSVPYLMEPTQVPEKYKTQSTSLTQNTNDPVLSHHMVTFGSPMYKAVNPDIESPLFSVMATGNYPNEKSKPPMAKAFLQVAGLDPMRDHALIYGQILRDDYSADTRVNVYPGFGHMFWTNWPEMETSKKFAEDTLDGIRWMLNE